MLPYLKIAVNASVLGVLKCVAMPKHNITKIVTVATVYKWLLYSRYSII